MNTQPLCSKLTITTPEQRHWRDMLYLKHWRQSGVFNVNFEHNGWVFV